MAAAICEVLREKIRAFLNLKQESIRWLARQTNTSYSTVYRLQSGEQQNLDFQNAQKILGYVDPENAENILSDLFPREMKAGAMPPSAAKILETLADNLLLFRVFSFAEAENPSREIIQKKYGDDGVALLERLLTMGALIEDEGGFKSTLDTELFPREEIIKKLSIHNYAMASLDNPGTVMGAFRAGLSPKGHKDAFYAVAECREKLTRIYSSEKGDRLFVASLLAGPGELT